MGLAQEFSAPRTAAATQTAEPTSTAKQRKNDTHASTSNPDSRLYRKAAGREAKLCYMATPRWRTGMGWRWPAPSPLPPALPSAALRRPTGCERCRLGRQQFGNADQVVGDQIEHEIGSDLGFFSGLLEPKPPAPLCCLPLAVLLSFCTTCGVSIEGARIGHMIGGVIGLIFANRYAAAGLLGLFHWLAKNGNKVKIFFCCPVFLTFLNFWNVVILVNRGFLFALVLPSGFFFVAIGRSEVG